MSLLKWQLILSVEDAGSMFPFLSPVLEISYLAEQLSNVLQRNIIRKELFDEGEIVANSIDISQCRVEDQVMIVYQFRYVPDFCQFNFTGQPPSRQMHVLTVVDTDHPAGNHSAKRASIHIIKHFILDKIDFFPDPQGVPDTSCSTCETSFIVIQHGKGKRPVVFEWVVFSLDNYYADLPFLGNIQDDAGNYNGYTNPRKAWIIAGNLCLGGFQYR